MPWPSLQANRFASAFLLPATTFAADVRETSLHGFLNLKPKWAMSVQSMVVRARELGLISPKRYGELFKQMGWRRWRQAQGEPLDDQLPAIAGARSHPGACGYWCRPGQVQAWEVPELLGLPLPVIQAVLGLSDADLEPRVTLASSRPIRRRRQTPPLPLGLVDGTHLHPKAGGSRSCPGERSKIELD